MNDIKIPQLTIKGEGQPLIWMHGMLNSVESDSVYSLVDFDQLSRQVQLIRYNACNKSISDDYTWNGLTNELLRIMESLNYPTTLLGGMSMGSGTALFTAIRNPKKVKALILVTPPPAWEIRGTTQALYEKIAQKARPDHIPEFLQRMIQRNPDPPEFFEQQFPGTRQKLLELRMSFDPAYYYSIYHGSALSDFPTREELSQLNIPTFIVGDPNDANHPIEVAREMSKLIPNAELFEVSGYSDYLELQERIKRFISLAQNNIRP